MERGQWGKRNISERESRILKNVAKKTKRENREELKEIRSAKWTKEVCIYINKRRNESTPFRVEIKIDECVNQFMVHSNRSESKKRGEGQVEREKLRRRSMMNKDVEQKGKYDWCTWSREKELEKVKFWAKHRSSWTVRWDKKWWNESKVWEGKMMSQKWRTGIISPPYKTEDW